MLRCPPCVPGYWWARHSPSWGARSPAHLVPIREGTHASLAWGRLWSALIFSRSEGVAHVGFGVIKNQLHVSAAHTQVHVTVGKGFPCSRSARFWLRQQCKCSRAIAATRSKAATPNGLSLCSTQTHLRTAQNHTRYLILANTSSPDS